MQLIWSSILVFIATNIDDIFILLLFFSDQRFKTKEIMIGQLLGIITLIGMSVLGAQIGLVIPSHYLGILGIFPIYLGIKALWTFLKMGKEAVASALQTNKTQTSQLFFIASVTIANGGDNVGIYLPLFAGLTITHLLVMVSVFLGMTLLWCLLAKYLTSHPKLTAPIKRLSTWLTPILLIILGIYIIYQSQLANIVLGYL